MHKLSHGIGFYKCKVCEETFKTVVEYSRHCRTHKDKLLLCDQCDKRRIHTGERPYACTECPKTFIQKAHLSYHLSLHKGEKAFACEYCGKCFTLKGNLTVHRGLHTGEKPYKCHVCQEGFRDSNARRRHVLLRHREEQLAYIKTQESNEL